MAGRVRRRLGVDGGRSAAAIRWYRQVLSRLPQERSLIVFESMMGSQYSDSPRAIHDALCDSNLDVELVWSVKPGVVVPAGVRSVVRWTPAWFRALATARVWVDNQGLPKALRKPERVMYIQTWHGTPLKRMGWNDASLAHASESVRQQTQAAIDRWDLVTSPSDYFDRTIIDAFGASAQPLHVGMPRNDRLLRAISAGEREQRLRALGLDADKSIVLFAPTRRMGGDDPDPWQSLPALPPGWQGIVRMHYSDRGARGNEPLIDVSAVDDMADLLCIADLLVTDYSSSMFDFALTDRPILLFQPDQERYLAARGAYFDIATFPPGPIARTTDELAAYLGTVGAWSDDWAARRGEYRSRFGTYEQGGASLAVVNEVIVPLLARRG